MKKKVRNIFLKSLTGVLIATSIPISGLNGVITVHASPTNGYDYYSSHNYGDTVVFPNTAVGNATVVQVPTQDNGANLKDFQGRTFGLNLYDTTPLKRNVNGTFIQRNGGNVPTDSAGSDVKSIRYNGVDSNAIANGHLEFDSWLVSDPQNFNKDIAATSARGNYNYTAGESVANANFSNTVNGYVTATAQWKPYDIDISGVPTKNGYTFGGWYTVNNIYLSTGADNNLSTNNIWNNPDGNATGNYGKNNVATVIPKDTEYTNALYAGWKPITYTVRFYVNASKGMPNRYHEPADGAVNNVYSVDPVANGTPVMYDANEKMYYFEQTWTYDRASTIPNSPWTVEGYAFKGWSFEDAAVNNGANVSQDDIVYEANSNDITQRNTYSKGYKTNVVQEQVGNTHVYNWASDQNAVVKVYAVWEPNYYILDFDENGGIPEVPSVKLRTDAVQNVDFPAVRKQNNVFAGWGITPQGENRSEDIYGNGTKFYYGGTGLRHKVIITHDDPWTSVSSGSAAEILKLNPFKTVEEGGSLGVDNKLWLYAWYNATPIFVDVYDGQFFEGQPIGYDDLLSLVSAFDYEDDYENEMIRQLFDEVGTVDLADIWLPVHQDSDDGIDDVTDETIIGDETVYNTDVDTDAWTDEEYDKNGSYVLDPTWSQVFTETGDVVYGAYEHEGKKYLTVEKRMEYEDLIRSSTLLEGDENDPKYNNLVLKIASLQYEYKNYVKAPGGYYADESLGKFFTNEQWGDDEFLSGYLLDTSTSRIDTSKLDSDRWEDIMNSKGKFLITYEVTDNGISPFDELDLFIEPVTMQYERTCDITYNNAPQIYIRNQVVYSDVEELFDINNILKNQLVLDTEDCINNPPWWYTKDASANTAVFDKLRGNNDTYNMLQDTLEEVRVWGIVLSSYLQKDVDTDDFSIQESMNQWVDSSYKKLEDLKYIKDHPDEKFNGTNVTNGEVFEAIISFQVELDATDQWGKKASGNIDGDKVPGGPPVDPPKPPDDDPPPDDPPPVGPPTPPPGDPPPGIDPPPDKPPKRYQRRPLRSVTIYIVNLDRNPDMIQANIQEEVRFIDDTYLNSTLGINDYWGEDAYGKPILKGILDEKEKSKDKTPSTSSGSFTGKNGDEVSITVNDYSE